MNKLTDKDINTIDRVNLGVGIVIILSYLFAFWNGEAKPFIFPIIFLLAAYMNCMWGVKRAGKNRVAAIGFFAIGITLCFIAVGLII